MIARESAEQSLFPRLHALLRLVVLHAIPNARVASEARRLAESVAADIAGVVNAACHLRTSAAIAYGCLVFKLIESGEQ